MARKKTTSTQERIEEYENMVKNLEAFARRSPALYRFQVGALAALGYFYALAILLVALAVALGVGYALLSGHLSAMGVKVELFALIFCGIIFRALWVRMAPPDEGLALDRQNSPRLFAMLDDLTSKLRAPKFHHVLLDTDFNAGVMQVPRLGILGWQRNYLVLGLPLMEALSPEQFQSVLAHEIGHLSGSHSRFAGWIYRVRQTWNQLMQSLDAGSSASQIFTVFFDWYAPFFSAYSFALARANEYEADRCAAQVAGAKNMADALVSVHIAGRLLSERYWPAVNELVNQQPLPPDASIADMTQYLRRGAAPDDAALWLDEALRQKTDYDDTHPALSDRLTALGALPNVKSVHPSLPDRLAAIAGETETAPRMAPAPVTETAAERYFGPTRQAFTERLSRNWQQKVTPVWKARFENARKMQQGLAELEEKALRQPLTDAEALQRVEWIEEFRGSEAAILAYEERLRQKPDDLIASFAMGRLLLENNDANGIALLEHAMAKEPGSVFAGCQIMYGYLMRQGRETDAETYRRRYLGHVDLTQEAKRERSTFLDRDAYAPHGLSAAEVSALTAQFSAYAWIKEVVLVRKVVTLFPEKPCFLLGFLEDSSWYQLTSDEATAAHIKQLASAIQFPQELHILALAKHKGLNKKIRLQPSAVIYRKL